ncbi:MAG: hypothetical protein HQ589_01750 [Syntrophaceae bacterium]|nr:hypothetical protein [Syntrophaceae bacterium]
MKKLIVAFIFSLVFASNGLCDEKTIAGNVRLYSEDPALIFDGSTASDTDYWMGLVADEGGDDNDLFQIGKGTTPGTTPKITLDKDGNVGIGTVSPQVELEVSSTGNTILDIVADSDGNGTNDAGIRFWSNGPTGTGTQTGDFRYDESSGVVLVKGSGLGTDIAIDSSGNVGIGTVSPNQLLTVENSISLKEIADANADTAAYGQIWVHNTAPNELWFTDDAGTDTQISPHPLDAPPSLYVYGPGIDWIGKRIQKYLGVIFWQTIDGVVTEELFADYNLRRKDVEGHKDKIKLDWDTVQLAKLRAAKMQEVVVEEITTKDALESIEITRDVQIGTKTDGYSYAVDKDGNIAVMEKTVPVMTKQGTGKFEKRLKNGVSFDSETGKFIHKRQMTEDEVDVLSLKAPEMPGWMKTWALK